MSRVSGSETMVAGGSAGWFYLVGTQQCGPVNEAELGRLAAAGQVRPETLVWRQGFADWVPYAQRGLTTGAPSTRPGAVLTYAQGRDEPTNIFGWWWRVVRYDYASFRGRARRKEFWSFALVNLLVLLPAFVGGIMLSSARGAAATLGIALLILSFFVYLALIVAWIAAAVRRLHDTGKSGWYYLVSFIPYIGGLILLVMLVKDSQPGTNQYGPNPKSPMQTR